MNQSPTFPSETQSFSFDFDEKEALGIHFKGDPRGLLLWHQSYGLPSNTPQEVLVEATLLDLIEAGATLSPNGVCSLDQGIRVVFHQKIKEAYFRTGKVPERLSEKDTLEVLEALKREQQKKEAEKKEAEREKEQRKEALRKAKKEAEENEAFYREDRYSWVKAHGSPRLQKALELGLLEESDTVYLEERLDKEYPGWFLETRDQKFKDILNPTLEALEALEEARKNVYPTADLVYISRGGYSGKVAVSAEILGHCVLYPIS